jgi:hypothetical protein
MIKEIMRLLSYVTCMGGKRNACRCLFRKPEENRAPRGRWEDNIEMDLTEGCGLNLPGSEQGSMEGSCKHDNEFSDSIK